MKVYFDATRLFIRGSRNSPTGIDRVVMAYAKWLTSQPAFDVIPVITLGGQLYGFPLVELGRLVISGTAFSPEKRAKTQADKRWNALLEGLGSSNQPPLRAFPVSEQIYSRLLWVLNLAGRVLVQMRPIKPLCDATYLNVSHTGLDHPKLLANLAQAHVRTVVMIHDLIPIDFPEFCAPGSALRHENRMLRVFQHATAIVANSKTTADDIRDHGHRVGRAIPEMRVAPLGLEPAFLDPNCPDIAPQSYFICVGTLEPRKNLTFLLTLWRRLHDLMGEQTPKLVMVGRRGWENESVIDHLERSKSVAQLVHEVTDIDDTRLAHLVRNARALVGPSFAEGFDLPVVEALALGTPVIASDIPAHREFASCATLIDPVDGPAWLAAIQQAALGERPRVTYSPPTWGRHFELVEDLIHGRIQ